MREFELEGGLHGGAEEITVFNGDVNNGGVNEERVIIGITDDDVYGSIHLSLEEAIQVQDALWAAIQRATAAKEST